MILKARKMADGEDDAGAGGKRKRRGRNEPLDVKLTVAFRFGDEPEDRVTMINQRTVPMVGGLIANRSRIIRGFVALLTRTALTQPRLARQLFPFAMRAAQVRGKGGAKNGGSHSAKGKKRKGR